MKIDTDNLSEITIYGLNDETMVDLCDLPDNAIELYRARRNECINVEDRYGFPEQWRVANNFFERVESLTPTECWKKISLEDMFESDYIAYTCYFGKGILQVTTSLDITAIPAPIVSKFIGYALLYSLPLEIK